MENHKKTQEELLKENADMCRRIAELEQSEIEHKCHEIVSGKHIRELEALHALGLAVSASLSAEHTSSSALRAMLEAVQSDLVFLFLREGDRLILQEVLPPKECQRLGEVPEHRVGECICGLAIIEGKLIFSRDIRSDPRCTWEECKQAGIRSFAALPIRIGEDIIGVIGLASFTDRDFETQSGFLETLVYQVSLAMGNARLHETIQRQLTEYKRVEESLCGSENKYSRLIETTGTGYVILDEKGRVTDVNQEYVRLTGRQRREDVIGHGVLEWTALYDHERNTQAVKKCIEQGFVRSLELDYLAPSGHITPIEINATILHDSGSIQIMSLCRDITERKQTEKALKSIVDKNPLSIQIVDNEGYTLLTNASHTRLFGVAPPPDYSIFKDRQIVDQGFVELFERVKAGESVKFPDFSFNVHDVIPEYPDKPIWLRLVIFPLLDSTKKQEQYVLMHEDITDRKRSEQILKESELKFRTLFDSANDAIFIIKDHIIFDCNRKTLDMFCCNRENIIGCTTVDFSPEIQPDGLLSSEKAAEKINMAVNGIPQFFEWRHRRMDGTLFDAEVSLNSIELGGNVYLQVIARDITPRKQAEELLQQSQTFFETIFEHSPYSAWVSDNKGTLIRMNQACRDLLHVTDEMLVGKYNILKDNIVEQQGAMHLVKRVFEQGETVQFTLRYDSSQLQTIQLRDTTTIIVRVTISPILDGEKKLIYAIIQHLDTTESKRAEEEINREREKLKTLSDNAPFGMALIDKEGHFTSINRKFTDLFGYDLSDIPDGRAWSRKAYPDVEYRHAVISAWVEDIQDTKPGEHKPRILTVTCKNGTDKTVQFIASVVLVSGDYLMTCEDITELRLLENQLRQAQKMEAIGTLAGGVAHDFNNLLTVIMGFGTLLQMELKELDPRRRFIDQILSASEKAANLTRSLLTFSRKQPINLSPISLNKTIKGTEKLLRRLLTEDIVLSILPAPEDVIIMADATQIDQILFNLTANARDAMKNGGKLTIETKPFEMDNIFKELHGFNNPGRYALLTVSDTGCGMDKKTREKIFDPFFTTKDLGKGTGLGLSTVYGIVKQHNGNILVSSELDMGTTFSVYLPIIESVVEEKKTLSSEIKRGNETILIAEDDKAVRGFIQEVLKGHGYTVIEATDGQDAIDKFKECGNIDLVVLDSIMPRKNGRETHDEICKIKPLTKTIFMSGHTKDILLDKGVEEGKVDFITKPILPNEMLKKVREVLNK